LPNENAEETTLSLAVSHQVPFQGSCEGKAGILMIEGGDPESAVDTLFFTYVVNHLIYADQNNLLPWVHMKPLFPCYDTRVHGNETTTFTMMKGAGETYLIGDDTMTCPNWRRKSHYPGPIEIHEKGLVMANFSITGNGLWETYFQPLSNYVQGQAIRSSGTSSIFRAFQNETHRTNTEGIVDIYSMSRCDFFVHGFSDMAKATVYIHPFKWIAKSNVRLLVKS